MDGTDIIRRFERQADGSWICREAVTVETHHGSVSVSPGQTFHYGETIDGLDMAELLERLGAEHGS